MTSPSPSTVTDEELVASIMAAIEAAPPTGGLSLTYGQVERGVRAALAARLTVTDDFNPFMRKLSEAELDEVEAAMTGKPKATVTDEGLVERVASALRHTIKPLRVIESRIAARDALEASGHTALLRENEQSVTCERVAVALNSLLHTGNTSPHWSQEMRRGAHALAEALCLTLGIELAALNNESKPGENG
jgi:hypothetical protein